MPPSRSSCATLAVKSAAASASPKKSSGLSGTPKRNDSHAKVRSTAGPAQREYGSSTSKPAAISVTRSASSTVPAKIETQSRLRQAGVTPDVLSQPRVGLRPTMLLNAAGTRPEPAVSVPSAKLTRPRATATADPELDPPGTRRGSIAFRGGGYGERTPTSPVADWSMLVLPT